MIIINNDKLNVFQDDFNNNNLAGDDLIDDFDDSDDLDDFDNFDDLDRKMLSNKFFELNA